MNLFGLDLGPTTSAWATILIAGFCANEIWRAIGVASAQRIRADGEVFAWIKAVATALVAGVVAQIVLTKTGSLAGASLPLRCAALAGGFAVYLATRHSILAGILAGEAILVLGMTAERG